MRQGGIRQQKDALNRKEIKEAWTSDVRGMRSIQIGIRGEKIAKRTFLDPTFVLKITDVTASFRQAHVALTASPPDLRAATAALWPEWQEERMLVPLNLRAVLSMDCDEVRHL